MENTEFLIKELMERPILVYGIGCIGKGVIKRLLPLNVNIVGIAVTCLSESESTAYRGIEIRALAEWKEYSDKAVVFISTSPMYHQEIEENCRENGFKNIIAIRPGIRDEISFLCYKELLLGHGIQIDDEVLSIAGGKYLNPFTNTIPNASGFFGQIGDFIFPSVYDDYSMVSEGPYELGEVKLAAGDVILDLGANLGTFSVYAASKGCVPYAFEPTPELQLFLCKQNELNRGRIHIVPYAVSNQCREAAFHINSFSCGANSLFGRTSDSDVIKVEQITIDEFVEREKLERVDFIKADIEGAERFMLEGAAKTLKKFAPKLSLCTYHLPDDREVLKKLILNANPNYTIEFRWEKLYARVNGRNILDTIRESEKTIVIFGASLLGRRVYFYLGKEDKIRERMVFCDNYIHGIDEKTKEKIIAPEELVKKYSDAYILVCVASSEFQAQIFGQLENLGFPKERIIELSQIVSAIREETDGGIAWEEAEKSFDWTEHRTQIEEMSKWVDENDKSVIDFGAGEAYLKKLLRPDVKYIPTDYKSRTLEFLAYDFNHDAFPDISADVCVLNQILYYIDDWKLFLEQVCGAANHKIIIFLNVKLKRDKGDFTRQQIFYSDQEIIDIILRNGFKLHERVVNKKNNYINEVGLLFIKR